ncbi:MAG TPA: TonB-dependent receptor, partial [Ferruginibacter sp.]|nr:TonB-dependent receptor [Ferruginibacter sp.]
LTLANLIDGGNQIPIRYTPRHRFASTIVKEWEHGWRMGIESSYTGYQFREDGSRTPGYLFIAAMISKEWKCGISVVLNGENLFDYRQSKIETMFTGTLQQPQFKSLWAPIDGRVLNLAMRYNLAPVFFRKSFLHS